MKRSIIILIALVLIVSLPVFASTPTQENAPTATSEDGMFLDMAQLSEEELMGVEGNKVVFEDAVVDHIIIGSYNNDVKHDIIVEYGQNGYVILEWNGFTITDVNHDGSITAADLALILVESGYCDGATAIGYANHVFSSGNSVFALNTSN